MRTATKLTVGFLFTVSGMLLIVGFCLNVSRKMHTEFELLKEDIVPGTLAISQMEGQCQQIAHDLMDYIVLAAVEEKVTTGLQLLDKTQREHLKHEIHIGTEEKRTTEELMAIIEQLTSVATEIIDLKKQGLSTEQLLKTKREVFRPVMKSLVEHLRRHKAIHMEKLVAAEEAIQKAHISGIWGSITASTLVIILVIIIAVITTRSIVKPLFALRHGIAIIGQGNLDYKVATEAKDEIGDLSRAFDRMGEDLKKTTTSIDNLNAANQQLEAGEQQLRAANQQLRANEEQLSQLNCHLAERVKELDCLYGIASIAAKTTNSIDETFRQIVNLIPQSWQYPEITCAQLIVEGRQFLTDNFRQTQWGQSAEIIVSGQKLGIINVCYLQEKPVVDEGSFLKEERSLINTVANLLGKIIEHSKTDEQINEKNRLNELLLDTLPHPAMIIRKDKIILVANHLAREVGAKIGGYCWHEFGQSEFIPDEDKKYINEHKKMPPGGSRCYFCLVDEALKKQQPARDPQISIWGKIWDTYWIPLDSETYLHYAIDVTERKQTEEELIRHRRHLEELVHARTEELARANEKLVKEIEDRKRLEMEILEISEREKRRMGRELHDGIGQQLTGIAYMAKVMEKKLADKLPDEANGAAEISSLVSQVTAQTRSLIRGLYPVDVELAGLASALSGLASNTEKIFGISCTFKSEPEVQINDISLAINLYRICQEAINNAIKHSNAKNINIELAFDRDQSVLTVESDGLDFPQTPPQTGGLGLQIMNYRARIINGSIDVRRAGGGGTVATCKFSLVKDNNTEHNYG